MGAAPPTESGKPLIVVSYAHADDPEKPAQGEVKWLSSDQGIPDRLRVETVGCAGTCVE